MLDVVFVEQLARRLGVSSGEGVDEGERLVDIALSFRGGFGGRLESGLGGLGGGVGRRLYGVAAAAVGQQTGGQGEREYDCKDFFRCGFLLGYV